MRIGFRGLAKAALVAAAVGGCESQSALESDRPPAQVGGSFSFGGFALLKPPEHYGYTGSLSPSEQALRERAENFDRTVWQGALIGAVVGTAIGVVAGGDAEDAAGGAIAGAAVGALAGIYVANKQKQYASREDQLESMVEDVRASNRETESLIADARAVLAQDRQRLAQVQSRYRQGQASEAQLIQERGRVWSNHKVALKAAVGARDRYRVLEKATRDFQRQSPGTATGALTRELDAYRQSLEALDGVAASMAKV